MRVYIPATLAMLRQLIADGSLRPVSGIAFAVTPTLREAYAQGGDDELAEVALAEAALASLRLLGASGADGAPAAPAASAAPAAPAALDAPDVPDALPIRRVVLVVDIDDPAGVTARPDLDDAVVRLLGPVPLDDVVAAYVDTAAAEPAVVAAVAVIDEADLGDQDAELAVGDAQDHDLAWYAVQELPFLFELL